MAIEVIDPRVKFGKQECGSHFKIHHLNSTSKSDQMENIGRKIFIKCSLFIEFDPLHCTKTAKPGI